MLLASCFHRAIIMRRRKSVISGTLTMKQTRTAVLGTILLGSLSFVGCSIFISLVYLLDHLGWLPGILTFILMFLLFMTATYALFIVLAVGFSILPCWQPLHNTFSGLFSGKIKPVKSCDDTLEKPKRSTSILCLGGLFCLMVSALNIFAVAINFHSYYCSTGSGYVKKDTWKSNLILDSGKSISNPVKEHEPCPSLGRIKPGDFIEKKQYSWIFKINGREYFNMSMKWKQEMSSHSPIFILGGACLGFLLLSIFKIRHPDDLINLLDLDNQMNFDDIPSAKLK